MHIFSRTYTNLEVALKTPHRVRRLSLTDFDVDLNDYASAFPEFRNLKALDIHVAITHPSALPSQIGELKTLKRLTLLNIPFLEFPNWIQELGNLEVLRVRGCELNSIPSFIGRLKKLRKLGVENCELSAIPKELNQLEKLKELVLSDTKISYFPLECFPPNLKVLDLGGPVVGYSEKELCRLKKALPKVRVNSMMGVDCDNM